MVISFCGGIEVAMLWMNANDGGILEEAIHESNLTVATYYVMLVFSLVKCITGFYVYKSFKHEYSQLYGDSYGGNDIWNDYDSQ